MYVFMFVFMFQSMYVQYICTSVVMLQMCGDESSGGKILT